MLATSLDDSSLDPQGTGLLPQVLVTNPVSLALLLNADVTHTCTHTCRTHTSVSLFRVLSPISQPMLLWAMHKSMSPYCLILLDFLTNYTIMHVICGKYPVFMCS